MKECKDTVTLYNQKYDAENDLDLYERTLINGVHWYSEVVAAVETTGLKTANKCTIRIPVDADFGDKKYVDPIAYESSNPDECFTLNAGAILVKGNATAIHPLPKDLQAMYADHITILGVTDMTSAPHAPHWKVVGA